MRIEDVCPAAPGIEDKLLDKHGVTMWEVREVLVGNAALRQAGRDRYGEMRYGAVGQTQAGRWLTVFFVMRDHGCAAVVTARDSTKAEKAVRKR